MKKLDKDVAKKEIADSLSKDKLISKDMAKELADHLEPEIKEAITEEHERIFDESMKDIDS